MEWPVSVCAMQMRRFPEGADFTRQNSARQQLQPEAIGAAMEVRKWLKS
jgi:hypothetical protein